MDKILEFWANYGAAIMTVAITSAGTVVAFLVKKIFNRTGNKVVNALSGSLVQMFGGDSRNEHIRQTIERLPFIKEIENVTDNLRTDWEIKIVEYKRRLLSPKLSPQERITFEHSYRTLMAKIGENNLSEETKSVLKELNELKEE